MRTSEWQDYAVPLALVFAIAFAFTLNTERSARERAAASSVPDYTMTVIAKRLPAECRGGAAQTPACIARRADTSVTVREGNSHEAARGY